MLVLTLIEKLVKHPYKFSFNKAVDAILAAAGVDIGNLRRSDLDVVKISSAYNLQSKYCDINKVIVKDGRRPHIVANLIGVAGVDGLLNDEYLEKYILHQDTDVRTAIYDFLDILSNSILSLRYLYLKKHNIQCMSAELQDSSVGKIALSFSGIDYFYKNGGKDEQESSLDKLEYKTNCNTSIQQQFYLAVQNFLWSHSRSSEGLRCILSGYFNIPVYIEQFVGKFIEIDVDEQSRIGHEGKYNVLNKTSYLGNKVWSSTDGINILIGPLDYNTYTDFLPKSSQYDKPSSRLEILKKIVRDYVPIEYVVKVYIFLNKGTVGQTVLNRVSRLSHDSFIHGQKYNYNTFYTEEI